MGYRGGIHGRKALTWMQLGAAWRNSLPTFTMTQESLAPLSIHTISGPGEPRCKYHQAIQQQSARKGSLDDRGMVQLEEPIDKTLNEMRHLARDLVVIKNNYWVWWMGWWSTGLTMLSRLYFMVIHLIRPRPRGSMFSKVVDSVRPGYVVKHLTTNDRI